MKHLNRSLGSRLFSMPLALCLILGIFSALTFSLSCSRPGGELVLLSGSENEGLEPLIQEYARSKSIKIKMVYKGSVDMMLELGEADFPYDAVWPANSLWVHLGDTNRRVKHLKSIMTSPIVFGVRSSLAEGFGWKGKSVQVRDILEKIASGKLSFMMTSATQSNSGAGAYLGFLYALAGNPSMLESTHLADKSLRRDIQAILAGVERSSGSSGWLKELYLKQPRDSMVNYEALILETNAELEKEGKEALWIVYPSDGISSADSPLGFVDRGLGQDKEKIFLDFQAYLLSSPVQKRIEGLGRRTGLGGTAAAPDPQVFRADWGALGQKSIFPVPLPARDVLREALDLYQSEFRKPSLTVYCLDFSGSMAGEGESKLKEAIGYVLDPQLASRFMLQPASGDISHIIAFSDSILKTWSIDGRAPEKALETLEEIRAFPPGGATDIHGPVLEALRLINAQPNLSDYIPSIILMTDGEDNRDPGISAVQGQWQAVGSTVPIFGITFGEAKPEQLEEMSELSQARIFDGRSDLAKSFRTAKGYN